MTTASATGGLASDAARAAGPAGAASPGRLSSGLLGRTGLTVSRLGFGCYRVDDETPAHRAALEQALTAGVNVVDTSTNYGDGASERLVGAVVRDLVARGRLRRAEVVVVSKFGYVQGSTLALAREREAARRAFPEMVRYAPGCWHSIHPEFLADQLLRSFDRLGLETLDIGLLHNPEYFLADAARRDAGSLADRREEFYRRLTEAFRFLEGQVDAGRLRWYGVSSNTVARPEDDPEATSLARMLEAARAAGGVGHRFAVLQCPMNLLESDPWRGGGAPTHARPPGPASVLARARQAGVGVLVNRPLNAIVGDDLVRLADVPLAEAGAPALEEALGVVSALEAAIRQEVTPPGGPGGIGVAPGEGLDWADQLGGLAATLDDVTRWQAIEWRVRARTMRAVRALDEALDGERASRWRALRPRYLAALEALLRALHHRAAGRSRARSGALAAAIDPWLAPDRRGESLSRKALWVLASTPGVDVVLNGMRTPAYVTDATGILGWAPVTDVGPVYEAAGRLVPALRERP